ncbi:DUF397 domain-containing protein [Actinacidiphila bryophytorum]|uniref:DUF397 domain-containing protein n=1 Tax=Actinacidiphila bryophytorum TaxID=1436133 RepID=UPI002176EC8F|nr:DUF397 domain-containing protein [Actinacidiphila bryophytorum]UWE09055.1 DUF397 domain-containing protein [Actinacidiphila bryophytorum]
MQPYIESASAAELVWVKSSYSGNNGNCVEVAVLADGSRAVRDSKDPQGPVLVFPAGAFGDFVGVAAKGGIGRE